MYKSMMITSRLLIFLFIISLSAACSQTDSKNSNGSEDQNIEGKKPKYIFLFIGDGMGAPQVALTQAYMQYLDSDSASVGMKQLNFTKFPVLGRTTTFAENRLITGSAAAGTALATGHKTTINTLSMKGDHSANLTTIAEMAKKKDMKVGIVSSVSIDHATPAAFYAHVSNRREYYKIASQMPDSEFDYFAGGYALGNIDGEGERDLKPKMQNAGYKIVSTSEGLNELKQGDKAWAYNHTYDKEAALFYEMDRPQDHISLSDFTQKGIEVLYNQNGFFMMIEGGKIDWACHANDAVAAANDVIEFDRSVAKALEFYHKHPEETLIIVTADHETGGLTLGAANTKYETAFEILKYQKISSEKLTELFESQLNGNKSDFTFDFALKQLNEYTGLGNNSLNEKLALSDYEIGLLKKAYTMFINDEKPTSEEEFLNYGYYNPLVITATHILNKKAGISWTSYSHTALPTPVFAIGQGQGEFSGSFDNTDIPKKIMKIAVLNAE